MEIDSQGLSPDEQLAQLIVDELLEQSVIHPSDAGRVLEKLASGQATSDDWNVWVENALERAGTEAADGSV